MGQVTTTQTFADGDLLTALKLTNILGNSSVDKTTITDQTAETIVAAGDYILFYDASANALRKIVLSELFGRPLAIGGSNPAAVTATTMTATTIVSKYVAKVWANVTVSGMTVDGTGVSSAVRNSAGNFTVNFSPTLSSSTYTLLVTGQETGAVPSIATVVSKSTTDFTVKFYNSAGTPLDPTHFSLLVFNNT